MEMCSEVAWDGNDFVAYVARLMFNNLFRDQRSPLLTMTSVCATIPKGLKGSGVKAIWLLVPDPVSR